MVVDGSAIVGFADDGTLLDFVILHRTGPSVEIVTVENGFETRFSKHLFYLPVRDFPDEKVAPANFSAMGLELNRSLVPERVRAIPEVFHFGMIHHQLIIQENRGVILGLNDSKGVPLTKRSVSQHHRVFAGGTLTVVPKPTGSLVGIDVPFAALFGVIPDLNLRVAAQVNSAVSLRYGFVVDHEFDVSIILIGREVHPMTIVDQLAFIHTPVLADILQILLSLCLPILFGHGPEFSGIEVSHSMPTLEIFSVEKGLEPSWWLRTLCCRCSLKPGQVEGT